MSAPDRSPLQAALAAARTMLLIAVLLWVAVWLISQIWVWLLVAAVLVGLVTGFVWWWRLRRDRW